MHAQEFLILAAVLGLPLPALILLRRRSPGDTAGRRARIYGLYLFLPLIGLFTPWSHWVLPWTHHGTVETVDRAGRPWTVDVYSKPTSNTTPPGSLPRIKVVASSPEGWSSEVSQTELRFGITGVLAVQGGIDVLYDLGPPCPRHGLLWLLDGGRWIGTYAAAIWIPHLLPDWHEAVPADLRHLVAAIHAAGSPPANFNPLLVVRAVNTLQGAGRERALSALRTYEALSNLGEPERTKRDLPEWFCCREHQPNPDTLGPLVALLFPGLTADGPVLQDDIPFLPFPDAGLRNPLALRLDDRPIRSAALTPSCSPIEAAERQAARIGREPELRQQAITALGELGSFIPGRPDLVAELRALSPRWDSRRQSFVPSAYPGRPAEPGNNARDRLIFGLAFAGYVLVAADVARRAWGRGGRGLTALMAAVVAAHVLLVWTWRFGGSFSVALAKGRAGFLVFHAALALIVAAAFAREPWAGRLVFAAFPIVTAGALGAAFRYDYVAWLRVPLLVVLGLALLAAASRALPMRASRRKEA